jgi:MPBQ/MSBQ methyltransferase
VDVGGGTGFTTLGIVKSVSPSNITMIDQSPHQLEKAREKAALKEVTILEVGFKPEPNFRSKTLTELRSG